MILVRYILILLIVYLLLKGFIKSLSMEDPQEKLFRDYPKPKPPSQKVSKKIGEYVDYEETGKKEK
jgi:hypothetical protein